MRRDRRSSPRPARVRRTLCGGRMSGAEATEMRRVGQQRSAANESRTADGEKLAQRIEACRRNQLVSGSHQRRTGSEHSARDGGRPVDTVGAALIARGANEAPSRCCCPGNELNEGDDSSLIGSMPTDTRLITRAATSIALRAQPASTPCAVRLATAHAAVSARPRTPLFRTRTEIGAQAERDDQNGADVTMHGAIDGAFLRCTTIVVADSFAAADRAVMMRLARRSLVDQTNRVSPVEVRSVGRRRNNQSAERAFAQITGGRSPTDSDDRIAAVTGSFIAWKHASVASHQSAHRPPARDRAHIHIPGQKATRKPSAASVLSTASALVTDRY
uniref:Uncharacterized protein n=1 Tax=Plectus sambesii TaxID=2011161 RepID=A0A914V7C8_9BILA